MTGLATSMKPTRERERDRERERRGQKQLGFLRHLSASEGWVLCVSSTGSSDWGH
ncbi:unnamed protein product [Spirodela intermedia]|uniref:Uncharacterized protein n=1 Tax=Spirodela intermedia TaxID=51605 RepID=A0A7I8JWU7_SPIIN|nr:unnamed protein product [Spirodela intermedia]